MQSNQLEFLASMYLECVCDEVRREFLKQSEVVGENNCINAFRKDLETSNYDVILEKFRKLLKARTVIMFQDRLQREIGKTFKDGEISRNITVLARSKEMRENRIDILRSELLHFYCNSDYNTKYCNTKYPSSELLLCVKDTVKIVQVSGEQNDSVVLRYKRQPCTIAYIRLDYQDKLSSKTAHVFFAFLFNPEERDNLLELLKRIRMFLAFRHDLRSRIEKDFNGNLYGERAEEKWRADWLATEKAGAHADSSAVSAMISNASIDSKKLSKLFETNKNDEISDNQDKKQFLKLIQNVIIAMYYRAVISEPAGDFTVRDNDRTKEPKFEAQLTSLSIGDLITFSPSFISLRYTGGYNYDDINGMLQYGKLGVIEEDEKILTNIPVAKTVTFRQKYLRAFIVDILCNIQNYGVDGIGEITVENTGLGSDAPSYLVFRNEKEMTDGISSIQSNYLLKQAVEFDHVDLEPPKGISLGCIAHFLEWAGGLIVTYTQKEGKIYYNIKLPIIEGQEDRANA